MPRLIRRRPLVQRIKDYFDIWDWLLWASEELETSDLDEWMKGYAVLIGFVLNFLFLLARANCGSRGGKGYDDVFGEYEGKDSTGWLAWFATFITHALLWFSILNTAYTFLRRRHYRLFENPVSSPPSTPSAQRVRVDSSPISSSPLRILSSLLATSSAQARAHPDPTLDVWELAVWDPLPTCLRLFCLFSPGHALIYWSFLPVEPSDPRPSVRVFTAVVLAFALSVQLSALRIFTSQQAKDSAIVQREVMNEYDIKYVHPRTRPEYRDVGTQFDDEVEEDENSVDTYRPTTIIKRGFKTNPNPNYAHKTDMSGQTKVPMNPLDPGISRRSSFGITSPSLQQHTPQVGQLHQALSTPLLQRDASSPLRPSTAVRRPPAQPAYRNSGAGGNTSGDGGNLGIYSNARSPLRKSHSTNLGVRTNYDPDPGSRDRGGVNRENGRAGSPLKRSSIPGGGLAAIDGQRFEHLKPRVPARRESGRF